MYKRQAQLQQSVLHRGEVHQRKFRDKRGRHTGAVSYTHLEVYKRQVAVCVGDAVPGWLCFTLALRAGTAAAALFGFLIGIPVLRLQGDYLAIVTLAFGAVSYTHLDVYKRQRQACAPNI